MDGFYQSYVFDDGFTPIQNELNIPLAQCVQCFGVVLAAVPWYGNVDSGINPFEHHRNNCYGWQKQNL